MLFFSRLPLRSYFFCLLLKAAIFIFFPNLAYSAEVSLAWDPNTEPELSGYKIYYGFASGDYELSVDVGNRTTFTVSNLENGSTYYFAATAYDTFGYESEYSNEVTYHTPLPCTYSISPTVQSFTDSGGAATVSVTTPSGCSWAANSNANWLVITSNSNGTGNGILNYSVLANTDISSRTGTLTIAGKTFTATQAGVPQYTLSLTKAGTGSGTVTSNPSGTAFRAGTVVTLTAIPDPNSKFDGWAGACTGTSPICSVTMNSNISVTATFTIKTYVITARAGANGSISPQGSVTVNHGSNKEFVITPNAGYRVEDIKVDGVSLGPQNSYIFANVTSDHTIEASFIQESSVIPINNLLSNGGFESGNLINWEYVWGMSVNSQSKYSGNFGVKMNSSGRIDQRFNTVIGKKYYVSARVRIDKQIVRPRNGGLVIEIRDASKKKLASSPYLTTKNSPAGTWKKVNYSFVATTNQSRLIFQNFSNGRFEASADDFIVS